VSTREEPECAWCAETLAADQRIIGLDWREYCCRDCRERGEERSREEQERLAFNITIRKGG
jgi:hypothetical protein